MNAPQVQIKSATLHLSPQPAHQTKDTIHAVVDEVLKRSGCMGCGLVAVFHVEFAQDPGPEFSKHGVNSANFEKE